MSFYDRYDRLSSSRDNNRVTSRYDIPKDLASKRKGKLEDSSVGKSLDTLRPITRYGEKKYGSVLAYLGGPLNPKQLMINDMKGAGSHHSKESIFPSKSASDGRMPWRRTSPSRDEPAWKKHTASSPFKSQQTGYFKSGGSDNPFSKGSSSIFKKQETSSFSPFKSSQEKSNPTWSTFRKPGQSSSPFQSKSLFQKPQATSPWRTSPTKVQSKSIFQTHSSERSPFATKPGATMQSMPKQSPFGQVLTPQKNKPVSLSWQKLTGTAWTKPQKDEEQDKLKAKKEKEKMEAAVRRQVAKMDETHLFKKQQRIRIPEVQDRETDTQITKWKRLNPLYTGVKYRPPNEVRVGLRWKHPYIQKTFNTSVSRSKLVEELKKPVGIKGIDLTQDEAKVQIKSDFSKDPNVINLPVRVKGQIPGMEDWVQIQVHKHAQISLIKTILIQDLEEIGLGPQTGWDTIYLFKNDFFLSDFHTIKQMGLDEPNSVIDAKLVNSKAIQRDVAQMPYLEESKIADSDYHWAHQKQRESFKKLQEDQLEEMKQLESPRFYSAEQGDQPPIFDESLIFVPPIVQLKAMNMRELTMVQRLVIIHPEFGRIEYTKPVDITGVDFTQDVSFEKGSIDVYPRADRKPPKGYKLNQEADIFYLTHGLPRNHNRSSFIKDCKDRCSHAGIDLISIDENDLTVHVHCEEW